MSVINMNKAKIDLEKTKTKGKHVLVIYLTNQDKIELIEFDSLLKAEQFTDKEIIELIPNACIGQNGEVLKELFDYSIDEGAYALKYSFDYSTLMWINNNLLVISYNHLEFGKAAFRYKIPLCELDISLDLDDSNIVKIEATTIDIEFSEMDYGYSLHRKELLFVHDEKYYLFDALQTNVKTIEGDVLYYVELFDQIDYELLEEAILVKMNFPNYRYAKNDKSILFQNVSDFINHNQNTNQPLDCIVI